MTTEIDDATLKMLQRIDTKLDSIIAAISRRSSTGDARRQLIARAEGIAAMTPIGVRQTDSVELLREDRMR
jgi:hypothetical protein